MVALPKFRDAFWWPPNTAPQMLFPRIARSRPWIRAGVVLLAVGTVLLLFGLVR